ncbi:unnamed protein product [Rotaria socialis]|uniref:Trimethylguanosine synthase n=2 Tax=Rotaria TaxID=231623 RepID=A0A816MW22_9BILA|nr:unnamed protein product [Rotaria magnacalcarata]CAF3223685.1 unnamed protein product [Rotaria socialis]CAF2077835.1 unnamed protein product [Rotaria magnacalcarata]CAF3371916.1 unnamed protein product [Rotaria socialis]CAF3544492.1 unnamed protein product [Rotaria socialis]
MSDEEKDELRQNLISRGYTSLLEYDELAAIGITLFGTIEAASLFGLKPNELFERNIRICARTGIEAVYDAKAVTYGLLLSDFIIKHVPDKQVVVIDPFLGSGNFLYSMAKYTKGYAAFGFDNSHPVYELVVANYAKLNFNAHVFFDDYANVSERVRPFDRTNLKNEMFVIGIAPPWGNGFDFKTGLNLNKTTPPCKHLIETYTKQFADLPIVFVIPLPEKVHEESLTELLSMASFYQIFYKGTRTAVLILTP